MDIKDIFELVSPKIAIEYYKSAIKGIEQMDLSEEEKVMHQMIYLLAIRAVSEVSRLDKE